MEEKVLKIIKNTLWVIVGICIGATAVPSFMGTNWSNYQIDFFFWWSIFSTVLGVIFLLVNVAQFVTNSKEREIHKSQVKIWQHYANGINHGLFVAGQQNQYSSVNDVQQAVRAIQASANSLYTSLNEERLFTEAEIKQKQLAKEKENEEFFKNLRIQNTSTPGTGSPKG